MQDVRNAVTEGFSSTELLKRYTTITMGPCQGRMCHGQMRTLAERLSPGAEARVSGDDDRPSAGPHGDARRGHRRRLRAPRAAHRAA